MSAAPTVLVTGRNGQLGWELERALARENGVPWRVVALDRSGVDLADADALRRVLRETAPAVILNAAAYTAVDRAETEPELAHKVNALAPGILAEEAQRSGALLVHYSTDFVFDGARSGAYGEQNATHPLSEYGRSKLEGERAVAAAGGDHLILRTSWVYAARGSNFVLTMLKLARERERLRVVADQVGCPTWARPLAQATTALLRDIPRARAASGLYHLAARGAVSRSNLARAAIAIARRKAPPGQPWAEIEDIASSEYPLPAARPLNSELDSRRFEQTFGIALPPWEDELRDCLAEPA